MDPSKEPQSEGQLREDQPGQVIDDGDKTRYRDYDHRERPTRFRHAREHHCAGDRDVHGHLRGLIPAVVHAQPVLQTGLIGGSQGQFDRWNNGVVPLDGLRPHS